MLLQGFNRVTAVSLLISGQALLEIAGSVLVFKAGFGLHGSYLPSMGWVTLSSAFIAACVGITAMWGHRGSRSVHHLFFLLCHQLPLLLAAQIPSPSAPPCYASHHQLQLDQFLSTSMLICQFCIMPSLQR